MCGVVGMIGAGKVQETLITGLEKLEYRGYDSAGIFVRNNETVGFFKEVGRIAQLKEIVDFLSQKNPHFESPPDLKTPQIIAVLNAWPTI